MLGEESVRVLRKDGNVLKASATIKGSRAYFPMPNGWIHIGAGDRIDCEFSRDGRPDAFMVTASRKLHGIIDCMECMIEEL